MDVPIPFLLLLRPEKAAARRRRTVRYALNFTVTETRTLEISLTSLSHFCTLSFSFPSVFLLWYTLPSAKWSVGGSSLRRGLCVDEWPFGAPGLLLMRWFCWFTRFHMQREDGGWRAVCLACSSKWNWIRSENPNQRCAKAKARQVVYVTLSGDVLKKGGRHRSTETNLTKLIFIFDSDLYRSLQGLPGCNCRSEILEGQHCSALSEDHKRSNAEACWMYDTLSKLFSVRLVPLFVSVLKIQRPTLRLMVCWIGQPTPRLKRLRIRWVFAMIFKAYLSKHFAMISEVSSLLGEDFRFG